MESIVCSDTMLIHQKHKLLEKRANNAYQALQHKET